MIPQEADKTHIEYGFPVQARSQDFFMGRGGGVHTSRTGTK